MSINNTQQALGSLGLANDAQAVNKLLLAFGPVGSVALTDYGLMIAALTATVMILVCVILLTDVQRQKTLAWVFVTLFIHGY